MTQNDPSVTHDHILVRDDGRELTPTQAKLSADLEAIVSREIQRAYDLGVADVQAEVEQFRDKLIEAQVSRDFWSVEAERLRGVLARTKRALLLCRDEVPADVWHGSPEDANAVEEALNDAEDVLGMDGSLRPWEGY